MLAVSFSSLAVIAEPYFDYHIEKGTTTENLILKDSPSDVWQGLSQIECETILQATAELKSLHINAIGDCQFSTSDETVNGTVGDKVMFYQEIPAEYLKGYAYLDYNPEYERVDVGSEAECVAILARAFAISGYRFYNFSPHLGEIATGGAGECKGLQKISQVGEMVDDAMFKGGFLPEPRSLIHGLEFRASSLLADLNGYSYTPDDCADVCGLFFNAYYFKSNPVLDECECFNEADSMIYNPGFVSGSTGGTYDPNGLRPLQINSLNPLPISYQNNVEGTSDKDNNTITNGESTDNIGPVSSTRFIAIFLVVIVVIIAIIKAIWTLVYLYHRRTKKNLSNDDGTTARLDT